MLQNYISSKRKFWTPKGSLLMGVLIFMLSTSCQEMNSSSSTSPKDEKAAESQNSEEPKAKGMLGEEDLTEYVKAMEDTLEMAYNKKDPTLFRRFYATDAVSYGEGREQIFGRSKLMANFQQTVVNNPDFDSRFRYHTLDVFAAKGGKQAVETGKWVETDSSGKERDHGFYMVLFELRDGRYISVRDMWNTATSDD